MMRPRTPPFALHIESWNTDDDAREVAKGMSASTVIADAAVALVQHELGEVMRAIGRPSSRPFRLALAALPPVLDILLSALVCHQGATAHSHSTLLLFYQITALHYVAIFGHLSSFFQPLASSPRFQQMQSVLLQKLGTRAPQLTRTPLPAWFLEPPVLDERECVLRVSVFARRAHVVAPRAYELHKALRGRARGRMARMETIFYVHGNWSDKISLQCYRIPSPSDSAAELEVIIHGHQLVALRSSASLRAVVIDGGHKRAKTGRFLPAEINWLQRVDVGEHTQREASPPPWFKIGRAEWHRLGGADGREHPPWGAGRRQLKPFPVFHASRVLMRAKRWKTRFRRFLGQATQIILDGRMAIPLEDYGEEPMQRPNMPSCYGDEAEAFIDSIIADYLVTDVVSWYPHDAPPIALCPIGTVPKKTAPYLRLVLDSRGPNSRIMKWPSNMTSLAKGAHIFELGSVCFSLDIGRAYIVSRWGGCYHRHVDRVRADGLKYVHTGCDGYDCGLACSKAYMGFSWRGHNFVFNSPMFGNKISGCLLATLLAPVERWFRARGWPVLIWVDDALFCIPPRPEYRHNTAQCGGIDGCFMCRDTWRRACKAQQEVYDMLEDLGFTFNEKRTLPSQRDVFLGLGWDTLKGTFWMSTEKAGKMATAAATAAEAGKVSRRELAKLRGKLIWFQPCLSGVRLLTRAMNAWIGNPTSDEAWDAVEPFPQSVRDEIEHWRDTLLGSAEHERPMWRLSSAQLLQMHEEGQAMVDVYIETDASLAGFGAIVRIRTSDGWEQHTTSVPWRTGDPQIQVQCEGEALHQVLRSFLPQLQGKTVLHVTDCKPTVGIYEKGSARSARLQQTGLDIWYLVSANSIFLTSAWCPGEHMVKSGCDGLSREGLHDVHNAKLQEGAWEVILRLAETVGFHLQVDWFASNDSHRLSVFWTLRASPWAEGTDAFTAGSWDRVHCSNCKTSTRRHGYFFPPLPIIDKAIARAKLDGVAGIFVVPRIVSAVWWPILIHAAVSKPIHLPTTAVQDYSGVCSAEYRRSEWNAVAVDFGRRQPSKDGLETMLPPSAVCHCTADQRRIGGDITDRIRRQEALHSALARALLQSDESGRTLL